MHYLVYLGYAIVGGELNIDPINMESITKWPTPTNITEVRISFGETQWKFIASFSVVDTTHYAIITNKKGL